MSKLVLVGINWGKFGCHGHNYGHNSDRQVHASRQNSPYDNLRDLQGYQSSGFGGPPTFRDSNILPDIQQ